MKGNYQQDVNIQIEVDAIPNTDGKTADLFIDGNLVVTSAEIVPAESAKAGSVVIVFDEAEAAKEAEAPKKSRK